MSRTGGAALERLRLALAVLLAGTAGFAILSVLTTASTPSVVLVAAAVATVSAVVGTNQLSLTPVSSPLLLPVRRTRPPVPQAGRVTDSPHHPLRPRAPGQV